MRRVLIPIAAGVALGVIVTGVLAFFMISKESMGWVDGLGRPLVPAPWLARLVFGASREWAGWFWFLADLVWFWGGLGIAFFLGSRAGEQSKNSKLPNALAAIIGIIVVIGTAYFTLHTIKMGVALALETRRELKPLAESADPPVMANFPLVDSQKWSKFSDNEQDVYVQGLLETWSFVLYSMTDSQKPSREFSDFIACIEKEKLSDFRTYTINNSYGLGEFERPPVDHLFNNASLLCRKYATKGDGSLRPARLIQKERWGKFSEGGRMTYLTGYIDFVQYSEQRILVLSSKSQSKQDSEMARFLDKKKNDLQQLERCIGQRGVQGLLTTLSNQTIEWRHPLPWSVATALGKTCPAVG
jgi:hypothetical protein